MGRSPSSGDDGLKKGPWSPEEDKLLMDYINSNGHGSWQALPKKAGLNRCGKSCRLRWTNYLRPNIKRGCFSDQEEASIINLHSLHGNKWSTIASHLPGRTDNEIKNFWNTHLRKKLIKSGIDPKTHKPIYDFNLISNLSHLLSISSNIYNHNNNQMMSTLEAAAFTQLQADHIAHQVATAHLLQDILQVINNPPSTTLISSNNNYNNFQENLMTILSSSSSSSSSYNNNNNFHEGLVNGTSAIHYSLDPFQALPTEFSPTCVFSGSSELIPPPLVVNNNNNNNNNDNDSNNNNKGDERFSSETGYSLPALAPASPVAGASSFSQMDEDVVGMANNYSPRFYDDWMKTVDNVEINNYFSWKDL